MAINWIETEVIEHKHWTDVLASIKFKGDVLPYKAGQFTKVGLHINGELISRPYSYVSAPNDDFLEIVYVKVPDGVLTPQLHDLKKGDKLFAMEKASGFSRWMRFQMVVIYGCLLREQDWVFSYRF